MSSGTTVWVGVNIDVWGFEGIAWGFWEETARRHPERILRRMTRLATAPVTMIRPVFVALSKHAQDAARGCGEVIGVPEVGGLQHHHQRRAA
jgi:hypothetical protein